MSYSIDEIIQFETDKVYRFEKDTDWFIANHHYEIDHYYETLAIKFIRTEGNNYLFSCTATREMFEDPIDVFDFNLVWNFKKNVAGLFIGEFDSEKNLVDNISDRYQDGAIYYIEDAFDIAFKEKLKYAKFV